MVSYQPPALSYADLRRTTDEFLARFNSDGCVPVEIEDIATFDMGYEIRLLAGVYEDVEVHACLANGLKRIFVDETTYSHRYADARFSIAHEVGHVWLHASFYEANPIRSMQDYYRVHEALGLDAYERMEVQAQNFAGLVLVPTDALHILVRGAREAANAGGIPGDVFASESGQRFATNWIADALQVAPRVIEKRLAFENVWAPPPRFSRA